MPEGGSKITVGDTAHFAWDLCKKNIYENSRVGIVYIKTIPKSGWLKDDITQEDDNHNDLRIAFATVLLKTNYSSDSN